MQLNHFRLPLLIALAASSVAVVTCAQNAATPTPAAATGSGAAQPAAAVDAKVEGLPGFLLLVPGGTVEMGLTVEQFIAAACQAASPSKPANAPKVFQRQLVDAMRRSLSILGRKKADVAPFYLGKWPVKNKEYESYVRAARAAGQKVRPPYLWWREGRKDDFEAKLPEINQQFPKIENAGVEYWERHGADLPYKLADKDGKPTDEMPVTTVSWREANAFAGSLGMRLPTETELTRAMRGDGTHVWPTAVAGDAATDVFTEEMLKKLRIYESRDKVMKPVGTIAAAAGPFGHLDLFGQVWQLCSNLGFRPMHGPEAFAEEWKRLQKDKAVGALLTAPPSWAAEKTFAKGGSWLSGGEPIQLLIDARAPVQTIDVLESLGFRLAKSLKPGYDLLYSLLRGSYNQSQFVEGQEPDLAAQVGSERYEMDANGFPTAYEAVSFAPVNWLTKEKNQDLPKLLDRSHVVPLLIGTLATTMPLAEPKLPKGLWSVLYRKAGVPKELVDAVKQGHKELIAAQKQKPKDAEPAPEGADGDKEKGKESDKEKDAKKAKKNTWRDVIARFGLTEADVLDKDAADGNLKFIRIDGIEVPSVDDVFLLFGNEGKVAGVVPTTNHQPVIATAVAPTLTLTAGDKGAFANLHFAVPLLEGQKRLIEFKVKLLLDHPAPAADKPWR
jgi:formylglycine-generating enzyme required for sulfatase activity